MVMQVGKAVALLNPSSAFADSVGAAMIIDAAVIPSQYSCILYQFGAAMIVDAAGVIGLLIVFLAISRNDMDVSRKGSRR
jgi:hypothetical protein